MYIVQFARQSHWGVDTHLDEREQTSYISRSHGGSQVTRLLLTCVYYLFTVCCLLVYIYYLAYLLREYSFWGFISDIIYRVMVLYGRMKEYRCTSYGTLPPKSAPLMGP